MRLCNSFIVFTNSSSFRFFTGYANISVASSENSTMMFVLPSSEVVGKRPVKSIATVPVRSTRPK